MTTRLLDMKAPAAKDKDRHGVTHWMLRACPASEVMGTAVPVSTPITCLWCARSLL